MYGSSCVTPAEVATRLVAMGLDPDARAGAAAEDPAPVPSPDKTTRKPARSAALADSKDWKMSTTASFGKWANSIG